MYCIGALPSFIFENFKWKYFIEVKKTDTCMLVGVKDVLVSCSFLQQCNNNLHNLYTKSE